jgi:hypothetical protein
MSLEEILAKIHQRAAEHLLAVLESGDPDAIQSHLKDILKMLDMNNMTVDRKSPTMEKIELKVQGLPEFPEDDK